MSAKPSPKPKTGEAPGRLDFLGGVADYSGSLVLEMPIQGTTKVRVQGSSNPLSFTLTSDVHGHATISWSALRDGFLATEEAVAARRALKKLKAPRWLDYVLGCLWVFCRAKEWTPSGALDLDITSTVPESMGVSSSAALEIATLRAFAAFAGKKFNGTELARLGQRAENEIVGAPCGLMDQLASAYGVPGQLLPILCRPDGLDHPVAFPAGVIAVGWPSGVKHSVAESPYATARAAAFMGRKIVEAKLEQTFAFNSEVPVDWWKRRKSASVPESLSGADFLARYGRVSDPLTEIVPSRIYPIRAALEFPILEHQRANEAVKHLRSLRENSTPAQRQNVLQQLGTFLYASHKGYSGMGLGSPETDQMVKAVKKFGPARGFYGARISGGGSGGTVVVLLEEKSLHQLEELTHRLNFQDSAPDPLIR